MLRYIYQDALKSTRINVGEKSPLLVLLHGLGSDEEDLLGLAPSLPPQYAIASLRAPLAFPYGGNAWFPLDRDETGQIQIDEQSAAESLEQLVATITSLAAQHAAIYLMGFSQGAMMSLYCTLKYPQKISGAVLMSGALLPRAWAERATTAEMLNKPFLITHGLFDELITIERGREIYESLQKLPVRATYKTYQMAHEVSRESLDDIKLWLEEME
jgi:phospholipase/carboxylesterase